MSNQYPGLLATLAAAMELAPLAEGKTKQLFGANQNNTLIYVVSKDDITAGDGAKHDIVRDKGKLSTQTTCNVFRLLQNAGIPKPFDIPLAFIEQVSADAFLAYDCEMLPYEIVVRREAHGSYLKRNPGCEKGTYFADLISEVFLKTNGKVWGDYDLPCDDPLLIIDHNGMICLHRPDIPVDTDAPFLRMKTEEVFTQADELALIDRMQAIAKQVFSILELAWCRLGHKLVDFKVEFGMDEHGNLLLADVIDNDSWRLTKDGAYVDKQVYRDGGEMSEVEAKYNAVAMLTDQFPVGKELTHGRADDPSVSTYCPARECYGSS